MGLLVSPHAPRINPPHSLKVHIGNTKSPAITQRWLPRQSWRVLHYSICIVLMKKIGLWSVFNHICA